MVHYVRKNCNKKRRILYAEILRIMRASSQNMKHRIRALKFGNSLFAGTQDFITLFDTVWHLKSSSLICWIIFSMGSKGSLSPLGPGFFGGGLGGNSCLPKSALILFINPLHTELSRSHSHSFQHFQAAFLAVNKH